MFPPVHWAVCLSYYQGMILKKRPDGRGRIQIARRFSDDANREVLQTAGPRVTATNDIVVDDISPLRASPVVYLLHLRAIADRRGKRGDGGRWHTSIMPGPPLDGIRYRKNRAFCADGDNAAACRDETILAAVEIQDGDRARRPCAFGQQGWHGGGDDGNGRDSVGKLAAQARREKASVRHSGSIDALRIDIQAVGELVEQRGDKGDVVHAILIGFCGSPTVGPGAVVAVRVDNDKVLRVGQGIEAGQTGHALPVTATAMEDQHERVANVRVIVGGQVNKVGTASAIHLYCCGIIVCLHVQSSCESVRTLSSTVCRRMVWLAKSRRKSGGPKRTVACQRDPSFL